MSPALRTKLDQCYSTRRTLFIIAMVITGLYTAWSLAVATRAAAAGSSVAVGFLLAAFGAVGLSFSLRAFLPLRTLENAPVTRLYRERAPEIAWVHAETKATTKSGHPIRRIVVELEDGSRHEVTLGALLPGFEEELLRSMLAEAPNAKPGPKPSGA
jgi:hypothetical protein